MSLIKFTLIYRLSDENPLCETIEDGDKTMEKELEQCKRHAKDLIHSLGQEYSRQPGTVNTRGGFAFHYIFSGDVIFLTLVMRSSAISNRIVLMYLEQVRDDFLGRFESQVASATRPFEFITYEPHLGRLQREYGESGRNAGRIDRVQQLNEQLADVGVTMTRNIEDILKRGDELDLVTARSEALRSSSKRFVSQTKRLNFLAMLRKYIPFVVVLCVIFGFLFFKMYWFAG